MSKIAIKNLAKIIDKKYSIGFSYWQPFDSVNGLQMPKDQLIAAGYKIADFMWDLR